VSDSQRSVLAAGLVIFMGAAVFFVPYHFKDKSEVVLGATHGTLFSTPLFKMGKSTGPLAILGDPVYPMTINIGVYLLQQGIVALACLGVVLLVSVKKGSEGG